MRIELSSDEGKSRPFEIDRHIIVHWQLSFTLQLIRRRYKRCIPTDVIIMIEFVSAVMLVL